MNSQTYISDELMQIAPGVNWPADIPFTVPADYFEHLPAVIMQQIQLEDLRNTMPAVPGHPVTVPASYFEELPKAILQRIQTEEKQPDFIAVNEELETLSPFLAAIPKATPFTVPAGYFESLRAEYPGTANSLRTVHRNRTATWLKWTVAACLTAFIGGSALLFVINNNNHHNNIEKQLEALDDQDIVNYLQTHTDPFDNDAFFATSVETTPVQSQLNEAVPLEAIEKYLQRTDLSKEVLPEKQ
ncbi:hypothetical protein [Chitinophaga polysaccharea]|uniref:hypothetical protein n=1 Tax=Chitinophaga polysaccharea TaxID=1293035 RepID=UPI00115A4FDC|nr:hypothetical protein [Chitinophaga polysaccharea]